MKNRLTAALLAFFLGGLGIHHFYLGKNIAGILSILFCWTLIPSIVGFINFIVLITMSDEHFNEKYNGGAAFNSYGGQMGHAATDMTDRLSKLNDLREKGVITDDEFQDQKRKILSRS